MADTVSDLSKLTVAKLKERINETLQEFDNYSDQRIPSKFNKSELIEYLIALEYMLDNNMLLTETQTETDRPVNYIWSPDFSITDEWQDFLAEHGWVAVKVPELNPDMLRDDFLSWIGSFCPNFDKNDTSTWLEKNLPPRNHGIFANYVAHTNFMWEMRVACAPIFAKLYDVEETDLLSSFCGANFRLRTVNKNKVWFHSDRSRSYVNERPGSCYQGFYTLNDADESTGGLLVLEKSHLKYQEYFDSHPADGIKNWMLADIEDSTLANLDIVKPCAPAGSLIIWDDRTFHCNRMPDKDHFRMGLYVSMQPRERATEKELTKRIEAYENGRQSGHWCYGDRFYINPHHPRSYGKDIPKMEPEDLEISPANTYLRGRLIGYES